MTYVKLVAFVEPVCHDRPVGTPALHRRGGPWLRLLGSILLGHR